MISHAEATANDRKGFRSHCPGVLKELGSYPDVVLTDGGTSGRVVTILGCECGMLISLTDSGEVLNVYTPTRPSGVESGVGLG